MSLLSDKSRSRSLSESINTGNYQAPLNIVREIAGKRILKIGGIAKAVGDIDEAIRALRKSRLEAIRRSL